MSDAASRRQGDAALEIEHLSSGYGESVVISDVSLAVGRGEIVALLGKNGMGKTTLLRTILGYIAPRSGSVRLLGREATGTPPDVLARSGVAYAPQEKAIFQDLSVRDNLRLATVDDRQLRDALALVFEMFPLFEGRLSQKAGTLSGGEQKMLMIARALMVRPRLMLIDEISEGLQPSVVEQIVRVLRHERVQSGTAMLLVEQNVAFALAIADRWAVLKRGEIDDAGSVGPDVEARIADHLAI